MDIKDRPISILDEDEAEDRGFDPLDLSASVDEMTSIVADAGDTTLGNASSLGMQPLSRINPSTA